MAKSLIAFRVLWLGWPLRFGPWRGFWHGEGRQCRWMFDVGPWRIVRAIDG